MRGAWYATIVGTTVVVPVVAAALVVDAGSTSTPVGMVDALIVTFAASVGATVHFTVGRLGPESCVRSG